MSTLMAKEIYRDIIDLMEEADKKFDKAKVKHNGWFNTKLVIARERIHTSLDICVQNLAKSHMALKEDFKDVDGLHESADEALEIAEAKMKKWFDTSLVRFESLLDIYRNSMIRAIANTKEKS